VHNFFYIHFKFKFKQNYNYYVAYDYCLIKNTFLLHNTVDGLFSVPPIVKTYNDLEFVDHKLNWLEID